MERRVKGTISLVDGVVCRQVSRSRVSVGALDGADGEGRCAACWWGPGGFGDGTAGRDNVARLPATLIFAGWDRTSAIRRKVPLTKVASAKPWHRALGDRSCSGGVPARPAGRGHLLRPSAQGARG